MAEPIRKVLEVPEGFRSRLVARYVWQLDDQSRRLTEATRHLDPEALAWQHAPGVNTIGMLFAHVAVAEVHITAVLVEGRPTSDVPAVLGMTVEDDGLPLPADGLPPAGLAGRDVAWFHERMARAREYTRHAVAPLVDQDLDRIIVRRPADGIERVYNVEWGLYHLVEHLAGHHAQILQLAHLHRIAKGA